MAYVQSVGGRSYRFPDLKTLLAKASPHARATILPDSLPKRIQSASRRKWRSPTRP